MIKELFFSAQKPIVFLIYILPLALLTGPFLGDFILFLISTYFLLITLKYKLWNLYKNYFFYGFLVFYILLILSSSLSNDPLFSFEHSLFYFRYLFFTFGVIYLIQSKSFSIHYFTIILVSLSTVVIIDSYMQFFTGYNLLGKLNNNSHEISTIFGRDVLAYYLVRLAPLTLAFLIADSKFFPKPFIVSIFILFNSIIIIFLTGDRSEFFMSVICYLIIIMNISFFKKIKLYFLLFISLTLLIIFSSSSTLNNRYSVDIYENIKKLGPERNLVISFHHDAMFRSSIKMFLDKPILGHGSKMFRKLCSDDKYVINYDYRNDNHDHSCSTHPHNIYMELLAQQGALGFLIVFSIFIYLTLMLLKNTYLANSRKTNNGSTINDSQLCLLSIIFINLFPFNATMGFFSNWSSIFLFFPVAIYLSGVFDEKK